MSEARLPPHGAEDEDDQGAADGLRRAVDDAPEEARPPLEDGPRRGLLAGAAGVLAVVLLWSLFRSVPESGEREPSAAEVARSRAEVERMANASDPSWMRDADTFARGGGRAGAPVPPVFDPSAAEASPSPSADTAGAAPAVPLPGTPAGVDDLADTPGAERADPRRAAFGAALRSRPGLGAWGGAAPAGTADAPDAADLLPLPPTAAEMEAAAEAEAERRSAVPGGEGSGGQAGIAPGPPQTGRGPSATVTAVGGPTSPAAVLPDPSAAAGGRPRASGPVVIPLGTLIEGRLHTEVVSDLPGHVLGSVTRDVYDATRRRVAIPRHSWLLGTYERDVAPGQARLVVQWTAVRLPDGTTHPLPGLRASDHAGASGLRGRVDRHRGAIFGQALLSSLLRGADAVAEEDPASEGGSPAAEIGAATAQHLGRVAAEMARRDRAIQPTITVPRLTRFTIVLDRDLLLPAAR